MRRSRGMVTATVMLFLIATVVFALALMLNTSSNNVGDGERQADSTRAFFLAESGLETAQASLGTALNGSGFTNTQCTGVGSTFSLGGGSITLSAVSTPGTCNNSSGTPCTSCEVTSTATLGSASRAVKRTMSLVNRNGTFCNGAFKDCRNNPTRTWQLNLNNSSATAGIGLFVLTYVRQGNNSATCAAGSNCRLQLDVPSTSNGANAVGLMGNAVLIPGTTTYPIYQTMTRANNNLAEVGGFFRGTTAPTLTGPTANPGAASYWDQRNGGAGTRTNGTSSTTTGQTNDGTATSGGTCDVPSASNQGCSSWCYGGDTIAFSFAANTTSAGATLTGVTFGTNANNVAMTQTTKYPTAGIPFAPANVDAEIWFARNPNLVDSSTGLPTATMATGASSYKGRGSGSVGARWTSNNTDTTAISGTTLTVGNSFNTGAAGGNAYPNQIISAGDTISITGGGGSPTCSTNCGTIVSQLTSTETGGALGGRGTYRISVTNTVNSANNRVWTISSNVLHVTACSICFFANGDALNNGLITGRAISAAQATLNNTYGFTEAAGGIGRYPINGTATYIALGTNLYAGTPGTTLYLPSTTPSLPALSVAPTPAMLLMVKTGTGVLASGTTVTTSVSSPNAVTKAFTVSSTPSTPLDGATLCAGTCAFFAPGTTTNFSLAGLNVGFNEWAGGFTCMKGVDITPDIVTSSDAASNQWTEPIQ